MWRNRGVYSARRTIAFISFSSFQQELILRLGYAKMGRQNNAARRPSWRQSMRNHFSTARAGCTLAIVCLTHVASAQGTPPAPLAIPNPTYTSIPLEITVNRPAAEVWKRVGKYCDIGEWLRIACTITSGRDGELGAVRSVGGEILVGKTELSYTYTQPVRAGRPYNLYHG